jgi:coiled-coil domain-containing protein 55
MSFNLGDTSVNTSLKYGLNPAASKKKTAVRKKPILAAFAAGDDDDDDDANATHRERANAEVLRQQAAAKRAQKVRRGVRFVPSAFGPSRRLDLPPRVEASRQP